MQSVLKKSGHAELAILALAVLLFAFLFLAQSARSCDFGQVEERTLNA